MSKNNGQIFISITANIVVTVFICTLSIVLSTQKIKFNVSYHFVCLYIADNALSASALSDSTSSYGGAGYILEYNDCFYIAVSCYYTADDATNVLNNLKKMGIDPTTLSIEFESFRPNRILTQKTKAKFLGNLNTLDSLSRLAYDTANLLDEGKISEAKAKSALSNIKSDLKALENNNLSEFTAPLQKLQNICDEFLDGYIYSKNLRYLQIAIADCIISLNVA
jgi:hypothetical protein